MQLFLGKLKESDFELTEEVLNNLVEALPGATRQFLELAWAYQGRNAHPQALAVFGAVIRADAANLSFYCNAVSLASRVDPDLAMRWTDEGLSRFPEAPLLLIERAKLWAAKADLERASEDARRAYLGAPDNLGIALTFTQILNWHGRSAEALETATRLLAAHPSSVPLLLVSAYAARGLRRTGEALDYAHRALRIEPGNHEVFALFADLAGTEGAYADEDSLTALLTEIPALSRDELVVRILMRLIWPMVPHDVDWQQVARLTKAAEGALPELPVNLLWELARLGEALGLEDFASTALTAALERTALAKGEFPPAAVTYVERFAKPPSSDRLSQPPVRRDFARTVLMAGLSARATRRHARAVSAFRLAAALAPEDMAAQLDAGFAELARGAVERAGAHFEAITRAYSEDMDYVLWPEVSKTSWPHAPFPCRDAFEALKPKGAEWPPITLLTPSYNQGGFIEETILSVLNQEYPNLQYIVVDGGSTDGTIEVLERYRSRLDALIVEPDRGQADALNKGFRLAKGTILGWVNSDDMLAPGALHKVALAWLRTEADLFYGICLAHRDYHFEIANMPAVRQDTFTLQHLGEIFKYWLKGHFFYQPEVFFTRRIWDMAGGKLDEQLFYTMDYKLFLACALNGARVEAVHWPLALFRQHAAQKTRNLQDCIIEQAKVRDAFVHVEPPPARREEVRSRLRRALEREKVRVGVVSSRLSKIFSPDAAADLASSFEAGRFEVSLAARASELGESDVIIKLIHLQGDLEEIELLRTAAGERPLVGWFWDNHHHLFQNFEVAERLDVVVPGHAFAGSYLRNDRAVEGPSLPLCVTQWSRREARELYRRLAGGLRSDTLYGGFVRYAFAEKRNRLIEELMAAGSDGVTFLEETNLKRYFSLSAEDRFRDWMAHKVSVCLPLAGDLSQRLFDALLTGQIPLVPADVHDLDAAIPLKLQEELPIVRFQNYAIEDVETAHRLALQLFDRDGETGALRRHAFALDGHAFPVRVAQIIKTIESLSRRL